MSVRPLSTGIKCLELLEVLSEQPGAVRLADVTRLIGESRATTYQRLATLVAAGWAETTEDGRYRLSPRALRIGSAALEQAGLGERALPVLNRLTEQTQETSSLVLTEGSRIIIAQRVEARGVLRADLRVGAELSFKESASGMVWGAFGPDSLRDLLHTSGVRTASDTRLRDVRRNGYAVSGGGETLQGIAVVAVPVLDPNGRCVASMAAVALHFAQLGTVILAGAIVVFLVLTAPIAGHMIGRATILTGVPLWSPEDGQPGTSKQEER